MQLVERGNLSLDAPLDSIVYLLDTLPRILLLMKTVYRPEFMQLQVLQEDGTFKPVRNKITLRMLLTHTSGFAYVAVLDMT